MGSFLPASALDTFFIFLVPFFSLPLSPFRCDIFCLLSPFWCGTVVSLPQNRTKQKEWGSGGNGHFLFFATTWASYYVLFSGFYLHMLSWGRQNDETVQWREKEFERERQKGNRETSQGSTACGKSPGLPVPTGTFWTLDTTLLFPSSSKRKTDVLSFCSPTFPSVFTTFQGLPVGKLAPQLEFLAPLLQLPGLMSNWTKEVSTVCTKSLKNFSLYVCNVQS